MASNILLVTFRPMLYFHMACLLYCYLGMHVWSIYILTSLVLYMYFIACLCARLLLYHVLLYFLLLCMYLCVCLCVCVWWFFPCILSQFWDVSFLMLLIFYCWYLCIFTMHLLRQLWRNKQVQIKSYISNLHSW